MLSIPALIIAIGAGHILLNPVPIALQDVPLVTDHDTIKRHHLDQELPLIEEFAYPNWQTNVPRKEKTT